MCFNTSIPVHQYTSIPVAAVTHATHGIDDSAFWISTPRAAIGFEKTSPYSGEIIPSYTVGNSLESSCRHVDHFCPSRPDITPGSQDHFYTSVWCKTRPPGPLLPPSRELLDPTASSWEFPGIVPRNSLNTAGPLSWYNSRTRGPPSRVLLGLLSTPIALLGETSPLGIHILRVISERP